jgi:hypothetical protein
MDEELIAVQFLTLSLHPPVSTIVERLIVFISYNALKLKTLLSIKRKFIL